MPTVQDMMFGQKGFFARQEPSAESDAAAIARLDRLSIFLDSAFRVPIIGTRIGADALLNFIPGAGLIVAKSLTAYIIWEAHRLGVPKRVLGRMLANLGIDFGISIVPLAGWVGDAFFRANLRNVALLKAHLHERAGTHRAKPASPQHGAPIIDGDWVRNPA
ncbi:DUF4112 domain-containing protein [Tianweitania populi]|uniref:DUF4112 domain-containing protein n=1 Tax=Tianweitania populi TaxID=1607949 RepID=A0A8J3DP55_9HYPH|nr:DUF4112 domain-containing protein [Tianweitania populi]GHD08734.1 hypothetical protein GCM10016234_08560 [Tianweitania populi]